MLSREDHERFSAAFDRIVLEAVRAVPLNIPHLHGSRSRFTSFERGWPAAAINYSVKGTRVRLSEMRSRHAGVLIGGIDEVEYRSLSVSTLKDQYQSAAKQAGPKFILAPGCSVPNEATPSELSKLKSVFALRIDDTIRILVRVNSTTACVGYVDRASSMRNVQELRYQRSDKSGDYPVSTRSVMTL